jgi:beta-RFAP synthase
MPASIHSARAAHHEPGQRVRVGAPGRLHLGFLDPAGTLGRRFGSLGLVIDGFETVVEIGPAEVDTFTAAHAAASAELERAKAHVVGLRRHSGRPAPLHLHLQQVLPAHAGFGSGTQLALAVGRAFAAWQGLDVATPQLAAWLGRGLRSGVGIAGFDQGGLLLDGGPGALGQPAPLLARLTLPEAWRVIVVLDPRQQGLAGAAEKEALARLAPLPQSAAADLCHQVLMQVLPGAADAHFEPFARGLTHMQALLGAHFAPAQAGSAYASAAVARAMQALAQAAGGGGAGIGQSSWGPTGFAVVPSADAAQALLAAAHESIDPALAVHVVRARNHGARIEALPASQRAA